MSVFDKHPASVVRLLSGWEYVNQAAFNAAPNIKEFLLGNRANWALVAKTMHFERDLEPQIYDDVLDYTTSDASKPATMLDPYAFNRKQKYFNKPQVKRPQVVG